MPAIRVTLHFECFGPLVGMRVFSEGVPPVCGYPHLRENVDYGELEAEYIIASADLERLKGSIRNGSACYVEALVRNL